MGEWNDFFIATAGASATLTGLIFVGVSISLTKILSNASLPDRALISLLLLLTILVVSILFLIPRKSFDLFGLELFLVGVIVWASVIKLDIRIYQHKEKKYARKYVSHMILNQLSVFPYMVGGMVCWLHGAAGLSWLVPAIVFSFLKAVLDAWVLLVEINR